MSVKKAVWELADELFSDIPEKEWEKWPTDLSTNLDHYIYDCEPADRVAHEENLEKCERCGEGKR